MYSPVALEKVFPLLLFGHLVLWLIAAILIHAIVIIFLIGSIAGRRTNTSLCLLVGRGFGRRFFSFASAVSRSNTCARRTLSSAPCVRTGMLAVLGLVTSSFANATMVVATRVVAIKLGVWVLNRWCGMAMCGWLGWQWRILALLLAAIPVTLSQQKEAISCVIIMLAVERSRLRLVLDARGAVDTLRLRRDWQRLLSLVFSLSLRGSHGSAVEINSAGGSATDGELEHGCGAWTRHATARKHGAASPRCQACSK